MTDKIQQARRAAFEAIYPTPASIWWHDVQRSYVGLTSNAPWWLYQDRFEVWCAALDSLCIELPLMDCIVDEDGFMHDVMRAKDVRAAIEQTNMGIKIK